MVQSTSHNSNVCPLHVAIIMDGNGRWATQQGLPRTAGHRAGVAAVRRTVDAALELGVQTLTLFAFTAGNWERPPREVATLMGVFHDFLRDEKDSFAAQGVRVSIIGRRDRLDDALLDAVDKIERATAGAEALHLRIAIDYSAREAILRAAGRLSGPAPVSEEFFARLLADVCHERGVAPDVDLLIRTGGEMRLSDCLLWESAYAELVFSRKRWPDFGPADLEAAVREFYARHRRFGRVPSTDSEAVDLGSSGPFSRDVTLKTA